MCVLMRRAYKIDIRPAKAVEAGRGAAVGAVVWYLRPVKYIVVA